MHENTGKEENFAVENRFCHFYRHLPNPNDRKIKWKSNQNYVEWVLSQIKQKISPLSPIWTSNEHIFSPIQIIFSSSFGEQLSNVSLTIHKYFPPLRSDYNLTDITFVYQANASNSQSCSEYITHLSLRCDHSAEEDQSNSSVKYELQAPNGCATGTCDGCTFYFLLRTPLACPICDQSDKGYRTFIGPCKFGRQEVRKIPHPYVFSSIISFLKKFSS